MKPHEIIFSAPCFSLNFNGAPAILTAAPPVETKGGTYVTKYEISASLRITREVTLYPEHDALRWVLWLENPSDRESGIVSDLRDCDVTLPLAGGATISTLKSTSLTKDEFSPASVGIDPGQTRRYKTYDGVSSQSCRLPFDKNPGEDEGFEHGGFPFFDVNAQAQGYILAIGWTGQWNAAFQRNHTEIKAITGLEDCRFKLLPGERIRTSSTLLMAYEGDGAEAHNRFRRLLFKHFSPANLTSAPKKAVCMWGGVRSEQMLQKIDGLLTNQIPFDYFWIDAGWYGCSQADEPDQSKSSWGLHTGEWYPNPLYHPNGLRDVADKLHANGKKLLLWLQPELVHVTSHSYRDNRDKLFKHNETSRNVLLDLGRPEVLDYVYECVAAQIRKLRVDCYRQDFCAFPLVMWRLSDAPDRKGISEIKHIMGLYAFWDRLLAEFPHLVIDNCAGGARRFDIEMYSRSVNLWRSDFESDWDEKQAQTSALYPWAVSAAIASGSNREYGDTYAVRSVYGSDLAVNYWGTGDQNLTDTPDLDWVKQRFAEYDRLYPLIYKDFYLLTPYSYLPDCWCVWQYHDPDGDKGAVLAFRRGECGQESVALALKGLTPGARYVFEDADTGKERESSGETVSITLPEKRSSRLLFYERKRR